MVQRTDDSQPIDRDITPDAASDEDDRLGEAIEEYLALAERDQAPDLEEFLARHDDMKEDLRAALEGLELVHGLVGRGGSSASGPSRGAGRWLESGHRIAGYRVVRELGRGGMGTVYEAVHVGLDRPVALKVLGTHAAPDSSARRRFLNEAKTAAGLHHTHIVPVFDVGQVGGLCYYAMQRIEGSGLDQVIRHLRRTRPTPAGPPGATSYLGDPAAGAGTGGSSSFGSKLGQIWVRVSPGWLWRQPRRVPEVPRGTGGAAGDAWDRPDSVAAHARSGLEGLGLLHPLPCGDSTASWGSQLRLERRDDSKRAPEPAHGHRDDLTGSAIGLTGLHAPEASGRSDEPPPFGPPRGSAYFRWVAAVGLQAADALAHAHHEGVIHRDVKPSNLLIDAKGNIWVTDFGLARRLADPGLTHHDSLLGTPRYMSPEQARTAGNIDGRTDVYSMGATLYELLTLRPPFDGQSAAELIDQIGRDEPLPPRKFEPRVPRDLETIVLKALAKRPTDRYATAAELAEDLARFLSHAPVKARRIGPVGRLWRVARRHPGISIVTTAAAATILAIATYAHVSVLDSRARVMKALTVATEKGDALEAEMRTRYMQTAQILESSDKPNRRGQGLDLIAEAVKLPLSPGERADFRDEAVKFLVLRDVVTRDPLATGHGNGLIFGPQGHRLWILSEDTETLSLWDVEKGRQLMTLPLRGGSSPATVEPDLTAGTPGAEPAAGAGASTPTAAGEGRARPRNGPPMGPRRPSGRSVAMAGNYLAVLLPEESGVTLIDAMSGTPLRKLTSPGHSILGVHADPAGRWLLTTEQTLETQPTDEKAPPASGGNAPPRFEFQVNFWDMDRLDHPVSLDLDRGSPEGRSPRGQHQQQAARPPMVVAWQPLVATSPDGKTIAVAPAYVGPFAPSNDYFVRLFSVQDGQPRRRQWINNQIDVTALALGPNGLMAAAGRDQQVRLYDTDSTDNRVALVTSFQARSPAWLLRFNPLGMLALARWGGPIELWDPAAQSRVAELPGSDQSSDLAFSPDGRTLAAVGRTGTTSIWTIQDSAMRTQLSGFDARPSSLAFGTDGALVGGGLNGGLWSWRSGRCPESGPPLPLPLAASEVEGSAGRPQLRGGEAIRGPGGGRGRGGSPSPPRISDRPTSLAFDAQGRLVAHDMLELRVWPAGPLAVQTPPEFRIQLPPSRPSFNAMPLARTPDGRIMAILRSSSVSLWRSETPGRLVPVTPPRREDAPATTTVGARARPDASGDSPETRFRAIQIGPGGRRLYLVDASWHLHVWDIAGSPDDAELHASDPARRFPPIESISSIALRPDGELLAVGDRSGSGTVTLIDTARQAVVGSIKPTGDAAETFNLYLALAFSPDGRTLAVGSQQGTVSLYSVDSPSRPRLRLRLPGHSGLVSHLAFDIPGTRLATTATAGNDFVVEVWDLELIRLELAQRGLAEYAR